MAPIKKLHGPVRIITIKVDEKMYKNLKILHRWLGSQSIPDVIRHAIDKLIISKNLHLDDKN